MSGFEEIAMAFATAALAFGAAWAVGVAFALGFIRVFKMYGWSPIITRTTTVTRKKD